MITKEAVLHSEKPRLIYGESVEALPEPQATLPQPIESALIDDAPTAG